jgi:hypothetical protein
VVNCESEIGTSWTEELGRPRRGGHRRRIFVGDSGRSRGWEEAVAQVPEAPLLPEAEARAGASGFSACTQGRLIGRGKGALAPGLQEGGPRLHI